MVHQLIFPVGDIILIHCIVVKLMGGVETTQRDVAAAIVIMAILMYMHRMQMIVIVSLIVTDVGVVTTPLNPVHQCIQLGIIHVVKLGGYISEI